MKKFAGLMLLLLSVVVLGQRCAQAGPLGIAGEYNVFVFGDIEQWGTDVEGRVAAGGNATYGRVGVGQGFSVASDIPVPTDNLVAGNNVILKNGSVGSSETGEVVFGGPAAANSIDYPSVGFGDPEQNRTPIDFLSAQTYLENLSGYWGSLTPSSTDTDLATDNIYLKGLDPTLNIFSLAAAAIPTTGIRFDFDVPALSTILVNITGNTNVAAAVPPVISLKSIGFFFNGIKAEKPPPFPVGEFYSHNAGYPFTHILFNFIDATLIDIDFVDPDGLFGIAIGGSVLAPYAHIDFGLHSHIDGNLIALSLTGQGESHNFPFDGNLPAFVPEPATLLLLAGGLVAMVARRRRK